MIKQKGFLSLERAFDDNNHSCVHIFLRFNSREEAKIWVNTDEHAKLIEQLDSYRTQDWEAVWYDTTQPKVEYFTIPLGEH